MRTSKQHRRKGVASAILQHIIAEATRRGYQRLSLETGSKPQFEAARQLYASYGFEPCGPFEGYVDDANSAFMTRLVNTAGA
jgi:putative acetyltransferase